MLAINPKKTIKMKRNLMLVGAFVASALYFTSCQNCDEAVAKEKAACEEQLNAKTAEMDAMNAEWTAKYDAAVATSDSLMMVIEEMNAPKTASTTTKKPTTTKAAPASAPAAATPTTPEKANSIKTEAAGGKLKDQSTGGKLKDKK